MIRRLTAAVTAELVIALVSGAPAVADPIRDSQWHLTFLNVDDAHAITQGEGVVVAIIDTGVDATHPDLQGKVLDGVDLTSDGGNGHSDTDGHGTAMAGVIVASGRALGVAPGARILPVRAQSGLLLGLGSDPAGAIDWAVANGATVICLASGSSDPEFRLEEAVDRAADADVVVVAAAGNVPLANSIVYPAAYPGVVAAVGVNQQGLHADVSVTGPEAVLAAPAVDIVSTDIRTAGHTGYRSGTGTSDATAIIAGAAALVRSKFPDLSAEEVVHRLTATATEAGPRGRDPQYGYGIVNLVDALTADVPALAPSASPATPTIPPPQGSDDLSGWSLTTIVNLGLIGLAVILAAAGVVYVAVRRRRS